MPKPAIKLTDGPNCQRTVVGVNYPRTFARSEPVVWDARTFAGADQAALEWNTLRPALGFRLGLR